MNEPSDTTPRQPGPGSAPPGGQSLPVEAPFHGLSLQEFLWLHLQGYSKHYLRRLVHSDLVCRNGEPIRGCTVREGDLVHVSLPPDKPESYVPVDLALSVLYEDDDILVLDKPAGLPVVPETYRAKENLVNGLLFYFQGKRSPAGRPIRGSVIHRLDKGTSGALVVAKSKVAETELSRQFKRREVEKSYLALVTGELPDDEGTIDAALAPHAHDRERTVVTTRSKGKPSITRYRVERRYRGFTLVEARPLTGRKHQIRVHLSHLGYPLAVDPLYGGGTGVLLSELKPGYRHKKERTETPIIARLTLHARRLAFRHPRGEARIEAEAPLPKDLTRLLTTLEKYRPPRVDRDGAFG